MKKEISKQQQYKELVNQRKNCSLCIDNLMTNTSTLEYETNNIGKWTDWQSSLDAKIILVGQDWGTVTYWNDNKGIDRANNKTNETLRQLFLILGYDIGTVFNPIKNKDLFFSNTVLCLKSGTMSSSIPMKVYSNCSSTLLVPLVKLINPKYIIALGSKAYINIMLNEGVKFKDITNIGQVCGGEPLKLSTGHFLFPVFHCGGLGLVNRRIGIQIEDWQHIHEYINKRENNLCDIKKVKQLDKITIKDLPFHENWPNVENFAFSFSIENFEYTNSSCLTLLDEISTVFWAEGTIPDSYSINDLRASLYGLFLFKQYTSLSSPNYKDKHIIKHIILKMNNLLYNEFWADR